MPYHEWDDEDFDWNGLYNAINYMHERMINLGRIGVHSKEKYGTARLSCYFVRNIHSLLYPGYVYNQYKYGWMWSLDVYYGYKFLKYTGLYFLIAKWQKYVYVSTYTNAVKHWPHLKDEILSQADQLELLEEAGLCKVSDYWSTT